MPAGTLCRFLAYYQGLYQRRHEGSDRNHGKCFGRPAVGKNRRVELWARPP